ncbi:hypothetical protein PanWU01x14_239740 [Parasponia andersonii]|uniref:DUF8040 domain-containing protein n=1 Tax=Parasponia andersonii TaxID=3476 RepID=A0A2P5BH27_PARAD|nr:hypothetical protein PanWU01x14_239740 [Parasponia andersonii]
MDERQIILIYLYARQPHYRRITMCIMLLVNVYVMLMLYRHYEKYILKNRTLVRHESRLSVLDSMIGHNDIKCVNQLRMDRRTFGLLCELLRIEGRLKNDSSVSVEEQVCMFLHVLAHHVKNRTIHNRFMQSGETISRHFNSVLNGVLRLQGNSLQMPAPIPENCTDGRWRCFKVCLQVDVECHIIGNV